MLPPAGLRSDRIASIDGVEDSLVVAGRGQPVGVVVLTSVHPRFFPYLYTVRTIAYTDI
jgi:hypothetical protein